MASARHETRTWPQSTSSWQGNGVIHPATAGSVLFPLATRTRHVKDFPMMRRGDLCPTTIWAKHQEQS